MRVLTLLNTLAAKYDSEPLRAMSKSITDFAKSNRKTGFRFTRLIESNSLYKHFKGYRLSGSVGEDGK